MPHISQEPLRKETLARINNRFLKFLTSFQSQSESKQLLAELLTSTEHLMLAKRLAIIIMLHNKCSRYYIAKTLKVSESTVARMWHSYENGGFDHILKYVKNKKEKNQFLHDIERLLGAGLPPIVGRGRWRNLP
jgi:uncharacterized protein YerC